MADAFPFELVSPERQLVSGEATQVVVPGAEGQFTVLANHAPFLSTLKPGVLEVTMADGSSDRIFVRGGFADANPDGLTLLAEEAQHVADMDMNSLDQAIQDAREDVADAKDDAAKTAAETRLAQLEEVKAVL
ncbi:MAG: F0F1 ATP synthase subunit epsilon [Rhizobiales bacterium]|nr:F0F1 ATP synthase subunit epsilon [Hyphomicrobiales bacterium]MBO6700042.1 F0F1 ATP synthase subunit epsilon [Hyphomicrobiales bacterium]MBO6737793.1 F0F1 ATP synthase subunit epsilon [Hyphomicrobiales bacterium]MBO6913150.1 F0F1 ATP synthase subunit epsilon [Hyphomicrobiales bacterium]MBO6954194.1 F0F1 ATP synthase subunit epsilon [Hyphomicrobiales bacterium]